MHLAISTNVQYIFFVQTFKWDIDIISVMPSKCKVWERLKLKLFIAVFKLSLTIMIFLNSMQLYLFSSINEGQTINSAVDELIDKHSEGIFVIDFVCN